MSIKIVAYSHKYGEELYAIQEGTTPEEFAASLVLDNYELEIEDAKEQKELLTLLSQGKFDEAIEFYNDTNGTADRKEEIKILEINEFEASNIAQNALDALNDLKVE
jgi:hypothetical protein